MSKKRISFLLCALAAFALKASSFTDWTEYPSDPIYAPYLAASLPDDYRDTWHQTGDNICPDRVH
jgi:hypothetical protein